MDSRSERGTGDVAANGVGVSSVEERDCRLHRAAFYGDVSEIEDLLGSRGVDASAPDKLGRYWVVFVNWLCFNNVFIATF
jgi:hypothetical protein